MVDRDDPDSWPKAEIFFDNFANHQATSVSADGKDIDSVTMRLKTDEAVEEAFAAIGTLAGAGTLDGKRVV